MPACVFRFEGFASCHVADLRSSARTSTPGNAAVHSATWASVTA